MSTAWDDPDEGDGEFSVQEVEYKVEETFGTPVPSPPKTYIDIDIPIWNMNFESMRCDAPLLPQ